MPKELWYESDNPSKVARGAGWRVGVAVLATIVVVSILGAIGWGIGVLLSDPAGKGNAIKQKNTANNRIQAQELFEQSYADIKAADKKVKIAKEALATDPADPTLRTNYTGVLQFCVSAVEDYNADARKYSLEDFRSSDLPYQIDEFDLATDCK